MDFFCTLLGVCSGMKFYRLALDWTAGDAVKYLLKLAVLLALAGAPLCVHNIYNWTASVLTQLEHSKVLPEFSIANGRAQTTLPQPHIRVFRDFAVVLDTTSATPPKPAGTTAGITITADSLLLWNELNPNPTPIGLALLPDGRVDAAYLQLLLHKTTWIFGVFMAALLFLLAFGAGLAQVAAFSGLAAFVEQGVEPGYRFEQLFCFGTLALTPAFVAVLIYTAFGVALDHLLLAYTIVFAIFFTGSTAACRRLLLPPGARVDDDD